MTRRLVFYVLLALCSLLGLSAAHAQTATGDLYYRTGTLSTGPMSGGSYAGPNAQAICDHYQGISNRFNPTLTPISTGYRCEGTTTYNGDFLMGAVTITRANCPALTPKFEAQTSPVMSSAPYGKCVVEPDPCQDKKEFIRRWDYPGSGATPAPNHYGVCEIETLKMLVCRKDDNGVTFCMWLVRRTGARYTGDPEDGGGDGSGSPDKPEKPPVTSPPIKQPRGQCPEGTVQAGVSDDGVPICMGTGSNPKPPTQPKPKIESEKNEQQPDGSTKNTKTTTETNADGSTTTTVTITITKPDGTKEQSGSTTTSQTPTGQQGTQDKPDDEKYDLCKQNPNLTICRNSSVSGTCGAITCVGDAIQCATLRAAAIMQCEQKADKDALDKLPQKALGAQIMGGTDPQKAAIDLAIKGTEVDLSKEVLDAGGFVGGGSCFPDRTISVMGKSVTVSFARVCQDIQPLRAAIMACAFIVAYLIVGRSVVQG